MYLKKYIDNLTLEKNIEKQNKNWFNANDLLKHFGSEQIPNSKVEEWKNFKTKALKDKDWKLPDILGNKTAEKLSSNLNETIVFKDGSYCPDSSSIKHIKGLVIKNIENYIEENPNFLEKLSYSPKKYAEERLSGILDNQTTTLLSLNCLINQGIVIELEAYKRLRKTIKIIHISKDKTLDLIHSPHIIIISKDGSEASFEEYYEINNCWINSFIETYLEKNSKLNFSRIQTENTNTIKTVSFNSHIAEDASLNLKILNREKSKEDIRIFLKGKNSNAKVSGIIASSNKDDSDIYCKIVHDNKLTNSEQNWRLISSENSKTSINGKIRVNKGAKKSIAKFSSKSIILNEKATSFSKPELEILEDDVKCSHGAAFGEIDQSLVFYLQSRGIKKQEAIKLLIFAFIEEIGFEGKIVFDQLESYFKKINYDK